MRFFKLSRRLYGTLLHRYDGIYKVRKYWPEQGKAGFVVWRYMLERKVVQPTPPPPPKSPLGGELKGFAPRA